MNMPSRTSVCLAIILASTASLAAKPHRGPDLRVGVYDSRAVSYAHFWSPPVRHDRDALLAAARAAKDAGDTKQLKELETRLETAQRQSMLEVFSTAPSEEAMAAIRDKLPGIQAELGVDRLVSKWDERALKDIPEQDRVDATDRLIRAFFPKPSEHLESTIKGIEGAKPLPLWQAKFMGLFGGL